MYNQKNFKSGEQGKSLLIADTGNSQAIYKLQLTNFSLCFQQGKHRHDKNNSLSLNHTIDLDGSAVNTVGRFLRSRVRSVRPHWEKNFSSRFLDNISSAPKVNSGIHNTGNTLVRDEIILVIFRVGRKHSHTVHIFGSINVRLLKLLQF